MHEYRSAERNGTVGYAHRRLGFCEPQVGLYDRSKHKYLVDAPFKISHKCCDVMKKGVSKKYEKDTGLKPIIGTMAE